MVGDERNIILTLARIWYTVLTGDIVSKDEASKWLIPQLPPEKAVTLDAAHRAYLGLAEDELDNRPQEILQFVLYAKNCINKLINL